MGSFGSSIERKKSVEKESGKRKTWVIVLGTFCVGEDDGDDGGPPAGAFHRKIPLLKDDILERENAGDWTVKCRHQK